MELSMIDPNNYSSNNSRYGVPRVTEILSAMLHEDYLMQWSNAIGLYKRQKYQDVLDEAAYIGTYVHKAIENFLSQEDTNLNNHVCDNVLLFDKVNLAFNSFLEWWEIIKKNEYEILMQEETLICKYFGGTLDMLIKINGKVYLVDFKTSNHSSYKHFLQLSAYRYMLKEVKDIEIDGCIILMLDKKQAKFTEYVLDFSVVEHINFINKCEECFLSLVYAYYNRGIVENEYKEIFGGTKNAKFNRNGRAVQGRAKQVINQVI